MPGFIGSFPGAQVAINDTGHAHDFQPEEQEQMLADHQDTRPQRSQHQQM
jgi:hypothetical protein